MSTLLSTEESLLRAVEDDPHDDATKLVLADYYDEVGDERAQAWRWVVGKGRRPQPTVMTPEARFRWRTEITAMQPHPPETFLAMLPDALANKLIGSRGGWKSRWSWYYSTPRDAFDDLVQAWVSSSPQEKTSYATWTPPQPSTKE